MASALAPTQPLLLECCASRTWAAAVAARGPYSSLDALISAAREVWWHQVGSGGGDSGGARLVHLIHAAHLQPPCSCCRHM